MFSPFAPEKIGSRDRFGCPIPRQCALSPNSGLIRCVHTGFLPLFATTSVYLHRQPPSGQSRVDIGPRNCVPMAFTAESPPA